VARLIGCWLCLALILVGAGCGGGKRAAIKPGQAGMALATPSATYEHPDEELLEQAILSQRLSPMEVANLSDRMLTEGSSTFQNEKNMARLDILLNKSISNSPREVRHRLLRNLGIIHYHQNKFSLARQELQQANELFPRDARTHFYLARLAAQNGLICQSQGLAKKAKGQFNLAANELEIAKKLEPSNPLYRQEPRQLINKERPLPADPKK